MKSLIFRCGLALGVTAAMLSVVSCSNPGSVYLPATVVYVIGSNATTSGTVQQYSIATAYGTTTPESTLTLPTGYFVESLATDVHGNLYVGASNSVQYVVYVYPPNASGTALPTSTINLTSATSAYAMALDASGQLYVATQQQGSVSPLVNVYAANTSGTATPLRTVQLTDFDPIWGIAVDDSGTIYASGAISATSMVGSPYAIAVYGSNATGAATPVRYILTNNAVYGVAADDSGDIYVNTSLGSDASYAVEEFAPTASGSSATPTTTTQLPMGTATAAVGGSVQLDRSGNFFASLGLATAGPPVVVSSYNIYGFTPNQQGTTAPGLVFTPASGIGQTFAVN
jgi:hypothetical protein